MMISEPNSPLSDNELRELALLRAMDRRGLLQPQGSPTEDEAEQERKDRASKSILEFARIYLPHYLYCEPSPLHQYLTDRLYRAITSGHNSRSAIAAPRGHAKTTWVSKVAPLWCICFPEVAHKKFILLISDTTDQAAANLIAIRDELEFNERIKFDFGELVGEKKWTENNILTSTGIRLQAYGTGKSLRGATSGADRPDLIIADDLENEEHVATPFQRDKIHRWWTDTALNTAGPRGIDALVVGTILHQDSVLQRLIHNGAYGSAVYRALLDEPIRSDLWRQWERIYTDPAVEDELARKDRAQVYYLEHKAEMDEGARVLWPEGDSIYKLKEAYVTSGPASFNREKQNLPHDPESSIFQEDWLKYWWLPEEDGRPQDLRLPQMLYTIGALDPSLGKHQKKGDYSAIIILGRGVDGRDYVLEADLARRPPDQIIADMIAYHQRYHPKEWAVEANQFQDFLRTTLESRALAAGVHLPTVAVHHTTDKKGRIESLQPAIRSGFIIFRATHNLLLSQLQFYTGHSGDHDDGPDALEMAYRRDQGGALAPSVAPDVGYRQVLGRSGTNAPHPQPETDDTKPSMSQREPLRVMARNPFKGR
jgi:predicted phage terminase large subunit-like protein